MKTLFIFVVALLVGQSASATNGGYDVNNVNTGGGALPKIIETLFSLVGEGVVTKNVPYVNALPKGVPPEKMEGWFSRKTSDVSLVVADEQGARHEYKFHFAFNYNGKTANGGRYINNLTIKGEVVDRKYFHDFKVNVLFSEPVNIGTIEEPLMAIQVKVFGNAKDNLTPIVDEDKTLSFVIRADGQAWQGEYARTPGINI